MASSDFDIIVIGAGVVGTSCALWLQRAGLNVGLIDRIEPGQGTSFGNAGVFADYANLTLNSPSLPLNIPAKLYGIDPPVSLRYGYALRMIPWFWKFLLQCRTEQAKHSAYWVGYLCENAREGFVPLMEMTKAESFIRKTGVIQIFKTEQAYGDGDQTVTRLKARNYTSHTITPADLADLEPNIKQPFYKGIYHEDAWNMTSPGGLVAHMAKAFIEGGGSFLQQNVTSITRLSDDLQQVKCESATYHAPQLVLASGAFSKKLKGGGAEKLPLDTERGYHLFYNKAENLVSRPVGWMDAGIFVSPINGGTRAAGTVEFGGLSEKKSMHRLKHVEDLAHRMLPQLKEMTPDSDWLGFRPTMPDCLPVIGRSQENPNIILAFGHQHLGMTLGGITGKVVSELATNNKPSIDIKAYSPDRF